MLGAQCNEYTVMRDEGRGPSTKFQIPIFLFFYLTNNIFCDALKLPASRVTI
jgi:hypothetical protein